MSTEQNKAILVRWNNALNDRNLEKLDLVADEIYSDDYILHDPDATGLPPGPAGIKQYMRNALADFPDMQVTPEDIVAEGDRVATRYTVRGTPVSQNKLVTITLFSILRFSEGKIVEEWELTRAIDS